MLIKRIKGNGIQADKKDAAKYFIIGADKGHTKAMFNYGLMLYDGDGIQVDNEEAVQYYKKAADKGRSN